MSSITLPGTADFDLFMQGGDKPDFNRRISKLGRILNSQFRDASEDRRKLSTLLCLVGWQGSTQQLLKALPAHDKELDLSDIRNTFAHLGYKSEIRTLSPEQFSENDFPCLHVVDGKISSIIAKCSSNILWSYDIEEHELVKKEIGKQPIKILRISELNSEEDTNNPSTTKDNWFKKRIEPLVPLFSYTFLLTFISNLLALVVPFYVMTVYDRVIGSQSMHTLFYVLVGALLVLCLDFLLRQYRARMLEYAGTRLNYIVGNAIFSRLLHLPSRLTERAAVGSQLSRLRDIEQVRSLLTGPLILACMDLPFTLLFMLIIFFLGGSMVLIPIVALLTYCLAGFLLMGYINSKISEAGKLSNKRQELLLESMEKMRSLRVSAAEDIWSERFTELSYKSAIANCRTAEATASVTIISQFITAIAGLATMAIGVSKVLQGELSTGGLIASMILVWRILAPLQGVFVALSRLHQLRSSVKQINSLMGIVPEQTERQRGEVIKDVQGAIRFERVTFRYGQEDPSLSNIGFSVMPGEIVAVIGRNGAGKSSILKLIAGLHHSPIGSVQIDGYDIRQFDPIELRQHISYVTQTPHFFEASLAQNLRFVQPTASNAELQTVLEVAGVWEEVKALPDGLNTLIDPSKPQQLSASVMTRLSLARAYLKQAPIVLMDEPINGLDFEFEFIFVEALERLRGKSTVMIVTHRPGHLNICDKVLLLDKGTLAYFGPFENVKDKMPREAM